MYYVVCLKETSLVMSAVIHISVFCYSFGNRTSPQGQKIPYRFFDSLANTGY